MKVGMFVVAIVATLVACGGTPEGEPTAAPAASAFDGGTPAIDIADDPPGSGGKVYCPTCPIQCDPTSGVPCPGGGGGGGGNTRQ